VHQPPTWVVGAGGLLGSHVASSLERRGFPVLTARVPWDDRWGAQEALRGGIEALADKAGDGDWNIAWCAGAGVVATSEDAMAQELARFQGMLADLRSSRLAASRGAFFLASSAGGVYAGSPVRAPFTEESPVGPLVAYGRAKLAMETELEQHCEQTGAAALVGRIGNLYGPGQDLTKQQGLISQLCKTHLTGVPLTVYVPLDTMRDYVFADDCGEVVAAGLAGLRRRVSGAPSPVVTKIIASGGATTIATLIGESTRLYKKRPHVVVKAPVEGTGQVVDLRLRSVVWNELDDRPRCSITLGMARTAADVGWQLRQNSAAR
jgi:UDP-glucose 4-epimerase